MNADILFRRAIKQFTRKQYPGAIADFTKAIELEPDFASAYQNRGVAKAASEDFLGAIADYTKVIELRPDDAEAYYSRGTAKCRLKAFEGGIDDFTKAIELKPDHAGAYYNRGNAYLDLDKKSEARADFDRARELDLGELKEVPTTHSGESETLKIIKRVAARFPQALVRDGETVTTDGSRIKGLNIDIPVKLKSSGEIKLIHLVAFEAFVGYVQFNRMPITNLKTGELRHWSFPKEAIKYVPMFLDEYNVRNRFVAAQLLPDGIIDVNCAYSVVGASEDGTYQILQDYVASLLDMDHRLSEAENGNLDLVIDFLGASKGSKDHAVGDRLSNPTAS